MFFFAIESMYRNQQKNRCHVVVSGISTKVSQYFGWLCSCLKVPTEFTRLELRHNPCPYVNIKRVQIFTFVHCNFTPYKASVNLFHQNYNISLSVKFSGKKKTNGIQCSSNLCYCLSRAVLINLVYFFFLSIPAKDIFSCWGFLNYYFTLCIQTAAASMV